MAENGAGPATPTGPSYVSQLVAQLESGGGAYAGKQPLGMADPVYGQYPAFASQYGQGAAGVDNYASQVLRANPNATFGDFYSGYVLGTGDPSNLPGINALQARYPAAYNNLVTNFPDAANLPLNQVVGPSNATLPPMSAASFSPSIDVGTPDPGAVVGQPGSGFGSEFTQSGPTTSSGVEGGPLASTSTLAASMPGYVPPAATGGPYAVGLVPGLAEGINSWITGMESAVGNWATNAWSSTIGAIGNWFIRMMVIILAIVLILVAAWRLLDPSGEKITVMMKGATQAAAA